MKRVPKILVYLLIIVVTIYLFISIAGNYASHIYLSEYKSSLKKKNQDAGRQGRLLRRSLRLCPSNAKTLFAFGKLYAAENSIDKGSEAGSRAYVLSKEFFRRGFACKPTEGKKRAEYAWYIGSNGDTVEAMEHFNIAIDSMPTDGYLHMLYAMWCVNQVKKEIDITNTAQFVVKYGNEQKRYETLNTYHDLFTNGVSIAKLLVISRMEWDKALLYRGSLQEYESESLADLNLLEFELDNAIENYEQANNKIMLSRCYIINGNYDKAVDVLSRIIKEDSALSKADLVKTEQLFMDVIDNDPENYRSFYWLGEIHTISEEIEKAIGNFKTTVRLNPKQIDAHLSLAELYYQTGELELEIHEYEAILEHVPNHKAATRLLSDAVLQEYRDASITNDLPKTRQ